ncbi:ArsR/SmtB family transcription factor [Streptomyces sp. NPDC057136]|uniref:ArsR/SmtB family transcription factor n=1 Tax=Streptomyces sp. NPDC057136 TaxID=3346029 RepID=UPI00362EA96C
MTPASATTADPATAAGSRALAHPAREEIRVEGVLHALSDPVRLRIVRQLAGTADQLACSTFDLPVSKSTSTHHFRVLRESGVIHQTYRGTAKVSGLRKDDLGALFPGLLDTVLAAADRQAERLAG